MFRGYEGDVNDGVEAGRCVVAVSMWCEYMGGTRGSGVVSNADDTLDLSVVRRVRGVDGVCEMCLARGWVEYRVGKSIEFGFTNLVGIGGVWDVCLS